MLQRVAMSLVWLASVVTAASDPNAVLRREFMQAYDAAEHGRTAPPDSAALRSYELYPYLQAARWQRALQTTADDAARAALDPQIASFLDQQGVAPVTRELRRAWLLDVADRQQWETFLKYYRADANLGDDAEVRCRFLNALLATQAQAEAATQIVAWWATPSRLPPACNAPFQWAQTGGVITPALIEQRARLVLKNGNVSLARDLIALLPAPQAEPLQQWLSLIDKPQQSIDALIAAPKQPVEVAALQDGWQRLARKDQDAAILRLPRLIAARGWNEVQASPYQLSLALALAWSRRGEALQYFDRVMPSDWTEPAYEWHARAALWNGDWPRASRVIANMPATLKTQPRWRYWLARCDEQLNDAETARTAYQQLIDRDDNYYAAMAAAQLHVPYTPHPQDMSVDTNAVQRVARLPGMIRARELVATQLRQFAAAEWSVAYEQLKPEEQLAAVRLARDWNWYEQAIAYAARRGIYNDYELLYPRPYQDEVKSATTLSGLPAELIYAQMRQESLYRPDARSSAGALGLLQLLPDTARQTARRLRLPRPGNDDLLSPPINIPLGAANIKTMIDSFDDQVVVGIAAYNAGPNAARRWLPDRPMAADVWIENIPYNETRNYVQRVLWHSLVFRWLASDKAVDAQSWLQPVRP